MNAIRKPRIPRAPHSWAHACVRTALILLLIAGAGLRADQSGDFLYSSDGASVTITGYTGAGGEVGIPETIAGLPVTGIGANVFYSNKSLTGLTMGSQLQTIGYGAFSYCGNLQSVVFGEGVTTIGESAFFATGLASVSIPDSVTVIGGSAFRFCHSLTQVVIGKGLSSLGYEVFAYCLGLISITVDPENPDFSSLDGVLFDKTRTRLIQYPGGKSGAYTVPDTVAIIGSFAFQDSHHLTSVVLGSAVTSIEMNAFAYCDALSSVTFGGTVTNIGDHAFYYCDLTEVLIPDSVVFIGDEAFAQNDKLIRVVVGSGTTSISYWAFGYCAGLTEISVDPANPSYSSLDGVLFDKARATILQYPNGRGGEYVIPDGVTTIHHGVFTSSKLLTSVVVPDSVTTIGLYAFTQCAALTRVVIGSGVTAIADNSFTSCPNLRNVYFTANAPAHGTLVFAGSPNAVVYYMPGTSGWGETYAGVPTMLWNPAIRETSLAGGVFRCTVRGTAGIPIALEASDNLQPGSWIRLESTDLEGGVHHFEDPGAAGHARRFYRIAGP